MANLISMMSQIFWPNGGGGPWEQLIKVMYDGIGSYIWTIIILTVVLRLLMTPLDYFQRRTTAKNTKVQEKMKPELEKITKACKGNREMYNKMQMDLYKKHGYNIFGSCAIMLANLVITMVVFFTLFGGLSNIANANNEKMWLEMQDAFYSTLNISAPVIKNGKVDYSVVTSDVVIQTPAELKKYLEDTFSEEDIKAARNAMKDVFNYRNEGFLWVKSIWQSDTITNTIPGFDRFDTSAYKKISVKDENNITIKTVSAENHIKQARSLYDYIAGDLIKEKGNNGYYILIIFAAGVTVLSQLVTRWSTQGFKKKNKDPNAPKAPGTGIVMMIVLPAIMLIFTLTSNAAFAIYIIVSQLISTATVPLTSYISKAVDKKQEEKKSKEVTVDYRRK